MAFGKWSGFDSILQNSAQMSRNASARYQYGRSPLPTGQPPVPAFNDPMAQPPPG